MSQSLFHDTVVVGYRHSRTIHMIRFGTVIVHVGVPRNIFAGVTRRQENWYSNSILRAVFGWTDWNYFDEYNLSGPSDFRIPICVLVNLFRFLDGCFCFCISTETTSPHFYIARHDQVCIFLLQSSSLYKNLLDYSPIDQFHWLNWKNRQDRVTVSRFEIADSIFKFSRA